jgi:organic hydroperoxide reductase OsmC/OhrA
MATHTYRSTVAWRGSTGVGYDGYDRTHRVSTPPAQGEVTLSGDQAFGGDPRLMNPEALLLAAASSCQLLSFLALAARSRIDVLAYDDEAEALMPEDDQPVRITRITLRPRIQVAAGSNLDRVRRLVDKAHDTCYVANSLRTEVVIEANITEV